MALILGIETSTTVCSVAIVNDGHTVATETLFLEKSHSSLLTVVIEDMLRQTNVSKDELAAIAVSKGPGSYTGLRIGVSTAKGLCYSLDKPLVAINTLSAMAYQVNRYNVQKALLCPMLDARRMEVYTALYGSDMQELDKTQALVLEESSFMETLRDNNVLFFGNGSDKFKPQVKGELNAQFVEGVHPSAEAVAQMGFEAFSNSAFEDVAYFEPFYLKDFIATKPRKRL